VQIACREEAAIARARQEGLVEGYFCVGIDLQPSRNGCGRLSDPSTSNTLELLTWTSVPASSTISGTCRCDSSSVDSELGALVNQSLATGLSLHGIRRLPTSTMATSARVYRSLQTCSHQPTHRRSMFPRGWWPSLVVTVVSKRLPQRGRLTTPSIVRLTPSVALGRAGKSHQTRWSPSTERASESRSASIAASQSSCATRSPSSHNSSSRISVASTVSSSRSCSRLTFPWTVSTSRSSSGSRAHSSCPRCSARSSSSASTPASSMIGCTPIVSPVPAPS